MIDSGNAGEGGVFPDRRRLLEHLVDTPGAPGGQADLEEHLTYLDALDRLDTFESLFATLPDQNHPPDPQWLETATVATATPTNPQAPVQQYIERVREFRTDHIRILAPVLSR